MSATLGPRPACHHDGCPALALEHVEPSKAHPEGRPCCRYHAATWWSQQRYPLRGHAGMCCTGTARIATASVVDEVKRENRALGYLTRNARRRPWEAA